ncbi:LemA family protein [Priestia aryabhattai]
MSIKSLLGLNIKSSLIPITKGLFHISFIFLRKRPKEYLYGTENRLAVARKDYNDEVAKYNKSVKGFPKNMFARTFGFDEKSYFEVTNEEKQAPKVDFGSDK